MKKEHRKSKVCISVYPSIALYIQVYMHMKLKIEIRWEAFAQGFVKPMGFSRTQIIFDQMNVSNLFLRLKRFLRIGIIKTIFC